MTFEEEINALIGPDIDGWTFHGDTDLDYDANVWYSHTPSEDRPEGQPLSGEELITLHEEYGIVHVASESSGRAGSQLRVRLNDIIGEA